jgi:ribose 5-phosphate isomerase A
LDKWKLRLKPVSPKDEAKRRAALEAVKHVKDGFVVGLGSGSTAAFAIQEIGQLIKQKGIRVMGIPSSSQSYQLAVAYDVPLTTLDEHPILDLTIDGADEIDNNLDMTKGGGGALTREKIVASASRKVIIVADETKLVDKLGSTFRVPVEVLPFGLATAIAKMKELGGNPFLREGKGKVGPIVTDNCNYIVDVDFGAIEDAKLLDEKLKLIPGVIESGLFIGLADVVYLGKPNGIIKLQK